MWGTTFRIEQSGFFHWTFWKLLILLAVCVSTQLVAREPPPSTVIPPARPELAPVPVPPLDSLEPMVRDQLVTAAEIFLDVATNESPSDVALADGYGYLGQLYLSYDFTEAAEICLLNARALMPEQFRWQHLLGYLYQQTGNPGKAVTHYRAAQEIRPESLPTAVSLGTLYIQLNQLDEARKQFLHVLDLDSGSAAAEAGLGQVALMEDDYETAITHLRTALRTIPAANRLHYLLAMAYRGAGMIDRAEEHLAQQGPVGVRAPDALVDGLMELRRGERVFLLEGQRAFNAGRFHEAAAAYSKAAEANPESVTARTNLGSALGRLGATEEAIGEFREALRIEPDNPTAHFNLGILLKLSDEEASIDHFRSVLEVKPNDPDASRELGRLLVRKDRFDEAIPHLRRAIALDPTDEESRSSLIAGFLDSDRFEEAIGVLETMLEVFPGDPKIANQLARLLVTSPDPELRDGERAYELALASNRALPAISSGVTAALALAELDRCADAAELQKRLIAAAEKDGEDELTTRLRGLLAQFEKGPPCRPEEMNDAP